MFSLARSRSYRQAFFFDDLAPVPCVGVRPSLETALIRAIRSREDKAIMARQHFRCST